MHLQMEKSELASGIIVLRLSGRITLGRSCQELEWEIKRLVESGKNRIVLEVAALEYVDSAGVGLLVVSTASTRASGGGLCLAGATGFVKDVILRCKVDTLIPMSATVEDAAASLGASAGASAG